MKSDNERWDMFLAAAITGLLSNPSGDELSVKSLIAQAEDIADEAIDIARENDLFLLRCKQEEQLGMPQNYPAGEKAETDFLKSPPPITMSIDIEKIGQINQQG